MAKNLELTAEQLLQAYAIGIFPMAPESDSDEIDWYDPLLRGIIPLGGVHLSKSLAKILRAEKFSATINCDFAAVVAGCANHDRTWISPKIAALYNALYLAGHAHSLEVWQNEQLVGGIYGVAIGSAFFGESMFSTVTNASKVALAHLLARLIRQGFTLCDTQYLTPHLATFGGIEIPRATYKKMLVSAISQPAQFAASVSSGTGSSAAGADVDGAAVAALLSGAAGASTSTFTGCSQSTTLTS